VPKRRGSKSQRYSVGYGRPPKATQFKPGRSGNPKGRPKGPRSIGAILQEVIRQKISVTEGGKTRRLPTLEVMLRRLVNESVKGDQKALKLLLSLVDRYSESSESDLHINELLSEDQAILKQFLEGAGGTVADRSSASNHEPDHED
jgi:uncharacterized protein DUF5681